MYERIDTDTDHGRPTLSKSKIVGLIASLVIIGMIYDTKIIKIGSELDQKANVFSPQAFGAAEFPKIQASIEKRAVGIELLAKAITHDKKEAGSKYGVGSGIGFVIPIQITAIAGESKSGIVTLIHSDIPEHIRVRVQSGPAINGTDLRDATGSIEFGQFKNQIEYQNAGAAINSAMKQQVLSTIDRKNLTGKSLKITGVFRLINPKNWLITPVRLEVQ